MRFSKVSAKVGQVPFISTENARYLYDLIVRERVHRILELGIAHGTATCYMAAALEELGGGTITSVDLFETKSEFNPSPEEQLTTLNLKQFVNIVRMQTGYTWFLHDEIKRLTKEDICMQEYDLCVIDGPKNWTIDACAFFLVDKLLRDDGWIIFDDYNWTYAAADIGRDTTDGITHRTLSENERIVPHVREIFELLVKQHPNYSRFYRSPDSEWAIARKLRSNHKVYTIEHRETLPSVLTRVLLGLRCRAKQVMNIWM